jgi:hypothetical protein
MQPSRSSASGTARGLKRDLFVNAFLAMSALSHLTALGDRLEESAC